MSVQPLAARPPWRRPEFWKVAAPVLGVFVALVLGLVAYQMAYGSNGQPNSVTGWGVTYPTPTKPPHVPLNQSVRGIVHRFVFTAVARKNLDVAYAISGPQIRQGQTLKQFLQGNIAVVPFDVDSKTKVKILKVDYSYATQARLEVFLATPGRRVTNSPHSFYANLVKQGNKRYINDWVPRWTSPSSGCERAFAEQGLTLPGAGRGDASRLLWVRGASVAGGDQRLRDCGGRFDRWAAV
jgi:hypothetical protein